MHARHTRAVPARESSKIRQRRMVLRRSRLPALAIAVATLALSACGGSSGPAPTSANFGTGATGVVKFWARQATDGPAKALVAPFNASHKNLKVQLHLTPPNDDTSQLATAVR